MTSRPARPRTLLDFINRPILKGVAPAGNLKRVFTGKSGQNRKKNFGRVMYASETNQNCKTPTGLGRLGEFSKVMQTLDCVSGLHNCLEFSQPPSCLNEAIVNTEKVLYCFYKIFLENNSTHEGKILFIYFLIEIDFLNTRSRQSYFPLANQNAHLTTHEPIKIRVIKVKIKLKAGERREHESDSSFEYS